MTQWKSEIWRSILSAWDLRMLETGQRDTQVYWDACVTSDKHACVTSNKHACCLIMDSAVESECVIRCSVLQVSGRWKASKASQCQDYPCLFSRPWEYQGELLLRDMILWSLLGLSCVHNWYHVRTSWQEISRIILGRILKQSIPMSFVCSALWILRLAIASAHRII